MDFKIVDVDEHYYEAEDAFTRHGDEGVKRFVRWMSEGKKRHIVFGTKMSTSLPNPTFNPVAKPGAFHQRLKDLEQGKGVDGNVALTDRNRYGELEALPDEYRDRDVRLGVLDAQGVESTVLFPTLGVGIEGLITDDVDMAYRAFHAFNLWLEEDWGFDHQGRLYGAPYIPMLDPQRAAQELDDVLARGARIVAMRPGPANGRSPADPIWDPFWARIDEAGIVAAYHGYAGPDAYDDSFELLWGRQSTSDPKYQRLLNSAMRSDRPMLDTALALVLGNLFGRFSNVRIASVELGAAWVPFCLHVLDHSGGLLERRIEAFGTLVEDLPSDVFKEKFWVSPYPEEDAVALSEMIGVDKVIYGSDWPHAEGIHAPAEYASHLNKLDAGDVRKIMRDNTVGLLR